MILIITTPFSLADLVETYKPESLEEFAEGEYTDLIINVDSYEPTILRSSLIEEKDTPIFAHLMGVPTHPGIGFPTIKSISVSTIEKNKYVKGVKYKAPYVYSWDDLGVLEVWLKKIEKEKDVPDKIDVDLRAKIRYEADVTSTILGGKQERELDEEPWLTINDVLKDSKQYGVFGQKGYVSLYSVDGKSATFVIRNSAGKLLGYLSVNEDQEKEFPLVKGSKRPEDYVRVRANKILDRSGEHALLEIDGMDYSIMEKDNLEGWNVHDIDVENNYIILEKNKEYILFGDISKYKGKIKNLKEGSEEFPNLIIKDISKGLPLEARLSVGTVTDFYKKEAVLGSCVLKHIDDKYIAIGYTDDKGSEQIKRLYVMSEEEKKRQTGYTYPRKDTLLVDVCDVDITLHNIVKHGFAEISLLSGRRKAYTTTDFSLHIPIEKRGINLSPKAMQKHIEMTERWEKQLNKGIEGLEKVVVPLEQACFASLAVFTILKFLIPSKKGVEKVAEKIVATGNPWKRCTEIEDGSMYCSHTTPPVTLGKEEWRKEVEKWRPSSGEATDLDKEARKAMINGEKATTFPIKDIAEIKGPTGKKLREMVGPDGYLETGKDFEVYAIHYPDRIVFYKRVGVNDFRTRIEDDPPDLPLDTITIKERKAEYLSFTDMFVKPFGTAVDTKKEEFKVKGVTYAIGDFVKYSAAGVSCEQVMDWRMCKIIFEACDPVICPSSRCDLGGIAPVENVIQSGLIGSLSLCIHNFGTWRRDGVAIPFCLSGILAALKNIRSYVREYKKCLEMAKAEGKTVGVCDKMRSIFMCEILWRQVITPIINLKGGIISKIFGVIPGGGEYVTGSFERGTDTINWFTQDYAKTIFLAYKSKATQEVGTEVCRAYVGGKFPSLGKFMSELATPEDPYQFTAWFTEEPYAPTQQLSQYSVYYHIYAGTPKIKENIRYSIRLRANGLTDYPVAQGLIASGDSASETKDFEAASGYQEICVDINGRPYCELGKIVSTDFGVNKLMENLMERSLAKKITKEKDCKATVGSTIIPGFVQGVAVDRRCEVDNPGKGYGFEDQWQLVGYCDSEMIKCWQRADLDRYPQIKEDVAERNCENLGGEYCGAGEECSDGIIDTIGGRPCCKGRCNPYIAELQWDVDEKYAFNLFSKDEKNRYRGIAEEAAKDATEGKFEGSLFNEFNALSRNPDHKDAYYFLKTVIYIKYGKLDKAKDAIRSISDANEQSVAYSMLIREYIARDECSKAIEMVDKVQKQEELSYYTREIELCKTNLEKEKEKAEERETGKEIKCQEMSYVLPIQGSPKVPLPSIIPGVKLTNTIKVNEKSYGYECLCEETGKWNCVIV